MATSARSGYILLIVGLLFQCSTFAWCFSNIGSPTQLSPNDSVLELSPPGDYPDGFSETVNGTSILITNPTGISIDPLDSPNFPGSVGFATPTGTLTLPTEDTDQGPITILFTGGVQEFGFFAEDRGSDIEQIGYQAFDGSTLIGNGGAPTTDNTTDLGQSVFVGGKANSGDTITEIDIFSSPLKTDFNPVIDNNFVIGSVIFGTNGNLTPTPEPSSAKTLLFLLGGLLLLPIVRYRSKLITLK
jgi:hypothetical protein